MTSLDDLSAWRERLAAATGDPAPDDPGIGADLKAALGFPDIEGDPTRDILAAMELCEAVGLEWEPVVTKNDIQHVKHPLASESSGFMIVNDNAALAMCRGIIAELWLSHSDR